MSDFEKYANIVFPVSALHIQLDTNTGPKGERNIQLFKSGMLQMPKMGSTPVLTSEFPFFTKYVRYPSSIEHKSWKKKYEFFFNRAIFMDRLRKEIVQNSNIYRKRLTSTDKNDAVNKKLYEWMQETEKHNIMVTLRSIFPIPEIFGKSLKNSYDHVLKNAINSRVVGDINIQSTLNIFEFMYKFGIASKDREEYFINIGGKRYAVDDVIWENDVINHPVYREFLKSQREAYEDVEQSSDDVQIKLDNYLTKFKRDLDTIRTNSKIQKEFYLYSTKPCNETNPEDIKCYSNTKLSDASESDMFRFLSEEIKHTKDVNKIESIQTLLSNTSNYSYSAKYFIHTYVCNKYTPGTSNTSFNDSMWVTEYNKCKQAYESEKNTNNTTDNGSESFDDFIGKRILECLKADTIITLKQHIIAKKSNRQAQASTQRYSSVVSSDRNATVTSVTKKLAILNDETDETAAADIVISIKDDFDNHQRLHQTENVSVFMDKEYELMFERFLKSAIEIKASYIVLKFAKENSPINLTGKNPNGTEVSPVMLRINKFVRDFYSTEANINNRLLTNVNNVFEPVRKSSNRELYRALQLFKYGTYVMKMEYKMDDKERAKLQNVLSDIHNEYISISYEKRGSTGSKELDEYLYTGIDEVKSGPGEPNKDEKSTQEISRTVQEIYVRMDLVDADSFEKISRAPCKLFDKELEQEFKYLADPRNEKNMTLSRFRDFDISPKPLSDKQPTDEPVPKNKSPTKREKTGDRVSRRKKRK